MANRGSGSGNGGGGGGGGGSGGGGGGTRVAAYSGSAAAREKLCVPPSRTHPVAAAVEAGGSSSPVTPSRLCRIFTGDA